METRDIVDLLKKKTKKDPEKYNLFICGPDYKDSGEHTRLRVYAYGGLLCKLPTDTADMELLDPNYLTNHLPEKPSLHRDLQKLNGNDERRDFLLDNLDDLLLCLKRKFTTTEGKEKERSKQTAISLSHTSFDRHGATVVCDFEFALPQDMSQGNFDLVTFSPREKVFTLVEYKCNARACGGKNGLAKHAKDMMGCMNNPTVRDWCKKELLRRLGYMCKYDLLKNCPDELKCVSPDLRPEALKLRAAFLFTPGEGLKCCHDAVELCRMYIPEKDLDKFLYCFAERPVDVGLSHMKNWEAFSGKK